MNEYDHCEGFYPVLSFKILKHSLGQHRIGNLYKSCQVCSFDVIHVAFIGTVLNTVLVDIGHILHQAFVQFLCVSSGHLFSFESFTALSMISPSTHLWIFRFLQNLRFCREIFDYLTESNDSDRTLLLIYEEYSLVMLDRRLPYLEEME